MGELLVGLKMIDWGRVFELRDEIGEEGFAEVVELFLDEVEDVVMKLGDERTAEQIEGNLHFLKGGAWNLGFADFGAHCADGERKAATGQAASVDLGRVADSYFASKKEFLSGVRKPKSDGSVSAA